VCFSQVYYKEVLFKERDDGIIKILKQGWEGDYQIKVSFWIFIINAAVANRKNW